MVRVQFVLSGERASVRDESAEQEGQSDADPGHCSPFGRSQEQVVNLINALMLLISKVIYRIKKVKRPSVYR